MNQPPHTPLDRARALLATGLAALLIVTTASGQTPSPEAVRRLQEENAALRKRLAEIEATAAPATRPAAATTTSTTAARSSTTTAPRTSSFAQAESDVLTLSPFEVNADSDYGYLRTNAATATRIGMEIQNIPMNINVMSEDFIKDAGLTKITDIFRYTASGAADGRFAMRRPANSSTPQGSFTMRGFTVNTLLRNGVFRYTSWNLDNVDRVEIVKGPAAVFFGQGYPGGVINYITKKPSFSNLPSSFGYQIDDKLGEKVTVDINKVLNEKTSFRLTGAWQNLNGDRKNEYDDNFNFTANLTFIPFKSGKVKINLELEHLEERFNYNDDAWIYRQGWFDAYKSPSAALLTAAGNITADAYRARIFANYGQYITDYRNSIGDPTAVIYTKDVVKPYARLTDRAGNQYTDKKFNFTNMGSYTSNSLDTFQATVDYTPTSWMDIRYVYTKDNNRYDSIEGRNAPNADGITWNAASGGNGAGYYLAADNSQLDVVLKGDFFGTKNKLILGGVYYAPFQQYMATVGANYYMVPGYNYPTNNPNNVNGAGGATVPNLQYLTNRTGGILTAQQVYSQWDPAIHVNPPTSKIYNIERNLLDGYNDRREAWYANWQITALDDKLTGIAGYRKETARLRGQWLVANDPWFITPADAPFNQDKYPPAVWNYSPPYSASNHQHTGGDAYMVGVSYAITPQVSVYATFSTTFRINTGTVGDISGSAPDFETVARLLLENNPGGYTWRGHNITSVQSALAAFDAEGATANMPNEEGTNREIGVKVSTKDNRLVGTLSIFKGMRKNQKLDDGIKQQNAQESLNYSPSPFALGSILNPTGTGARVFRWRTVGLQNEVEGTEFDLTWTPNRNFQLIANGAWLWDAHTVASPSYAKPGSTTYNGYTAGQKANADVTYNSRLVNVPELRFNLWGKYTLTDGAARGLSAALGARYASAEVVSQTLEWNPLKGGFQAGNYVVFDASFSYPWEVLGYKLHSSLGINNVLDKVYYEGTYVPSDPRLITLRTTVSF